MIINRSSKTPVYRQIYDDINLKISRGEYSLGSMLPSENKLCSIYGVERATVRRALALMVNDGKVSKIPGLGTSVLNRAEAVSSGANKTLLFLLSKKLNDYDMINEPFNAKLMDALDHECSEEGYALLYKPLSPTDTADQLIQSCNPSGVFFMSLLPFELYQAFRQKGIPVVLLNQNHPICPSVCLDNKGGAKMVMEHLLALGHREIGFIGATTDHETMVNRFAGYKSSLERNGLPVNEDWIVYGDWAMESGKKAMRQLLARGKYPTAVFAANDAMAIGAMMATLDMGITIPGGISFVGFDNINQAMYMRPTLTTVAVDYHAMARSACMLLFDMIGHNGSDLSVNIYVPLNLLERESTCEVAFDESEPVLPARYSFV